METVASHALRIRSAIDRGEAARSLFAASWQRCRTVYGLDPERAGEPRRLGEHELRHARERIAAVLSAGQPAIERLRGLIGSGACLLLADTDGVPLQWWGSDGDADDLRHWGLWPGNDWSEQREGTNGIGTCLVEKRPLIVRHDQHFFLREREITCVVAPVFDHRGDLAGALNVTLYRRDGAEGMSELLLAAVIDAAQQIETAHFHRSFPGARILSVDGRRGAGLIAVDRDEIVLGATRAARQTLGIDERLILDGCCVTDLFDAGEDGLAEAERGVLRRALVRQNGNVTAASRVLDVSLATMKRKMRQYGLRRSS